MYAVAAHSPVPDLWQALADPTRRELLDRLSAGPRTTSQLCEGMPMSRFGVMKHLGVLERAGLVIGRKHGRLRMNHLNAAPLHGLERRWLSRRAGRLAAAVTALDFESGDKPMQQNDTERAAIVEVALEWQIGAPVQRIWRKLFEEPHLWWPQDFRAGPSGSVFRFEPALGSTLREEGPEGAGLIWYTLIALTPFKSLDLSGNLASRYGGPATSLLHIAFEPGPVEGSTILKLTDSLFGRLGPGMAASVGSGWQSIFGDGLQRHVEEQG
jgi:DNA-binding transcriptional ArsR family regulator